MISLAKSTIKKEMQRINKRKEFSIEQYEHLLDEFLNHYTFLKHCDLAEKKEIDDKYIIVRHDVDHDYLTAMKMAEWERRHNIRATYCLLHTSWYYGRLDGDRYVHSQELIETAKSIQDKGHEINFHNNLVSVALRHGLDPLRLLEQELEFFRTNGIVIKGTSTHGDALCRELNYRNWELFKECCCDRFGGPRTLVYEGERGRTEVDLGLVSMSNLGLTYEAYDFSKDVYHTDSGCRMRTRQTTRGRVMFDRANEQGAIAGILTHPIWWSFD